MRDGQWSSWTSWSQCSNPCDGETKKTTRTCDDPKPSGGGRTCEGDATEQKNCDTQHCPGFDYYPVIETITFFFFFFFTIT